MCNKEERRKKIEYLKENVQIVQFVQKQPYTFIQVKFPDTFDDNVFTAFAKCCYPDVYNADEGMRLVLERCAADAIRTLEGSDG